jgi:hypothetical protein
MGMEPLGALSGAAGGMADAVGAIIEQRLNQARVANQAAQAQATLAEAQRRSQADEAFKQEQLKQQSLDRQANTAENVRYHNQLNADRVSKEGQALNESMPPGTDFSAASPMAPYLTAVPKMLQAPAPPSALAADPTQGPANLPGTIANAPSPVIGRLLTKTPTFKQADTTDKAERAWTGVTNAAENAAANQELRGRAITAQIEAATARQQAAAATAGNKLIPVKTVDENGRSVTRYLTPDDVRGQTFKAPPSAVTANRLDSAEAVTQTGNDLVAKLKDPAFAAKVGPEMGRYNTLKDFIGNPPPEFTQLAGEIESYALANMGVHGMRSVQGSEKINELLNKRHTPESMIAAIQGLQTFSNHFMENQGRPVPGAVPASGGRGVGPGAGSGAGGSPTSSPGKSGVTKSGIPWSKE